MAKASDSADGSTTAEVAPGGASAAPRRSGRARPASAASAPSRRRWPFLVVLLLAWAVGFANAATWALITPIGASPDEPAHIVKAGGVVRGQLFGEEVDGTQTRSFVVPRGLSQVKYLAACTMGQPNLAFVCGEIDEAGAGDPVREQSTAGLYNPSYYALVGWPSLLDQSASGIMLMRLTSAILVSAFAALAIAMLSLLPRSRLAVTSTAFAFTPMLWFLGGSVNPNALEVTGTAAFFAALLVVLRVRPRGRLGALAIATLVVSGGIVTQVRTLGVVWLGVAVLVALAWVGWRRGLGILRQGAPLAATAVVLAAAGVAMLVASTTGTLGQNGVYPGVGTPFLEGFRVMLERTFLYLDQAIGLFGWGEAPAPGITIAVHLGVGMMLVGIVLIDRPRSREAAAVLLALAAFVLLPALIQAGAVATSGYIWQGRYSLPLIAILVVIAALGAGEALAGWLTLAQARRLRAALAWAAAIAGWCAAITALRRHTVGYDADTWSIPGMAWWSPPLLPAGAWMLVLALVAAAAAAGLLAIAERGARSRRLAASRPEGVPHAC